MKPEEFDKELLATSGNLEDVEWHDIFSEPITIHGVHYDEGLGFFVRMPMQKAVKVRKYMDILTKQTAGGRIRFSTNSPYVAITAEIEGRRGMYHMPLTGSHGFGVFENDKFLGNVAPTPYYFNDEETPVKIQGSVKLHEGKKDITIYFPQYNGVKKVYVGIKKGSTLAPHKDYKIKTPVLFYGSSITQGGCCSHAGNDYVSHLSRWLDFDYINFGFSGTSGLENEIQEYMINQKMSLFFMDFDAWSFYKNADEVIVDFVKKLRAKQPHVPVVLTTRPDVYKTDNSAQFDLDASNYKAYKTLKKQGYKNVYYVNVKDLFGKVDGYSCTVDTTHPNDLGFYQMAKVLYPIFKKALKKHKKEQKCIKIK